MQSQIFYQRFNGYLRFNGVSLMVICENLLLGFLSLVKRLVK